MMTFKLIELSSLFRSLSVVQNQNDNYAEMLQYQLMEQAKMMSQSQPFQPAANNNHHNTYQQQAPNPKPVTVGKVVKYFVPHTFIRLRGTRDRVNQVFN